MPTTREEADKAALLLSSDSPPDARLLRIGMLGLPGVGKSTLVNRLAMFQACATSQKINTTRSKQNVVFTQGNTQLVFMDLPGLMSKEKARRLNVAESIIRDPHAGIFQADIICVVVDASRARMRMELDKEILKALYFFKGKPTLLVLTKTDKLGKRRGCLLDAARRLSDGVVHGRVCHSDRYNHRYRRGQELPRSLLPQSPPPPGLQATDDDILRELEAMAIEEEEEEEEEAAPDDAVLRELEAAVDEKRHEEPPPSEESLPARIDAFFDADEARGEEERLPAKTPRHRRRRMSPLLALLLENMQMRSAGRDEVAERVRRWHALDETVRGRVAWRFFRNVFMVSAATGRGVDYLRDYLIKKAKPAPWAYHSSLASDQDPYDTVCFAVQANCFNLLAKEVPYAVTVEVTEYDKAEDDTIHVEATIFCRTERHMKMVLGVGGETISKIARGATTDLQNAFQTNVALRLAVKRATIPKRHLRFIKKSKNFGESFPMLNL